ncbi:hypothetical protein CG471_15930 [Sphingobium sp. IP1]|uniref:hypothetical protein n=1 Tax=Sphingobium sp. IP1 TaxID=2021637 RepID=UPI000C075882|nr:hypothetical protein [Sphingobium sp. IP1]PHP18757.1 hypothetical protein CG471_15930 [Sphingobium sp. IP1]
MRGNAINMLRQAARAIDPNAIGAYDLMLEQLSLHLADLRDGKQSWAEFAEFYCLTERDRRPSA